MRTFLTGLAATLLPATAALDWDDLMRAPEYLQALALIP